MTIDLNQPRSHYGVEQPTLLAEERNSLPFPELFDSSMLAAFDSCEIKGFREYMEHWSPNVRSVDLVCGGALAAGFETARNALWIQNVPIELAIERGILRIIEFWGDFEGPEGHPKTLPNTVLAFEDYFQHYSPSTDPISPYIKTDGTPAVEFSFAYPTEILHPITGQPILYGGRFDLLGYFQNTLYIIDEKSSKNTPNERTTEHFKMRGQFLGYAWAAGMSGYKVNDALVRVIVIQKTQFKQLQYFITLPDWQIDRWYEQMNRKIARLVDAYESGQWSYSYGDACSSYGGCAFLPLCISRDPSKWVGEYTKRKWDPLRQDPSK